MAIRIGHRKVIMTAGWVTLVLGKDRVVVPREDLISNSEYFDALLSTNFRDYQNSEHRINYDVDIYTLRSFVDWVSDHAAPVVGDRRHVKPSLAQYVGEAANYDGLLRLLELSVLFASDTLIQDLTDLIACHWLIPQKCVQIWLLGRDLGLVILKDLAKATCIERLQGVPVYMLLELPAEDFIELVGNINVRVSDTVPINLTRRWVKRNVLPGEINAFESHYPFTLMQAPMCHWSFESLANMHRDQCWKYNIQCVVGHKRTPNDDLIKCIYAWDGANFSEVIELPRSLTFSTHNIEGMRIVGRGFDIYFVGGEYGDNSKRFLTEIWRYSMISKTWYYVTSSQIARRNLAIIFLDEILFLVGSSRDCLRYNSTSFDVYNVYTREWKNKLYISKSITDKALVREEPYSVSVHEDLTTYSFYKNGSYSVSDNGKFVGVELDENGDITGERRTIDPQWWMTVEKYKYLVVGRYKEGRWAKAKGSTPPKIFSVKNFEHHKSFHIGDCKTYFFNQVANGPYLFGFSHKDDTVCIEMIKIDDEQAIKSQIIYKEKRSDIKDLCPEDTANCFNICNPKSLKQLLVFEEKAE